MSDRELLELAAKAAGYGEVWYSGGCSYIGPKPKFNKPIEYQTFNPLDDDGDALRLAVKVGSVALELAVNFRYRGLVYATTKDFEVDEVLGTDPYAATRRAITRAAAEIGRNMK